MNMEERAAQAAAWKAAGQCNCTQAVMKAFEDKIPVDADTLMKLGAGYAAGTACVELRFADGSMISIDCTAVENEVADNMYQRSELDDLIYNDPVAYADLILNGDPETYPKTIKNID